MRALNLVGCGHVGRTLARLWHEHGVFAPGDVLTRSRASAEAAVRFVGGGRAVSDLREMRRAEAVLVATPDSEIAVQGRRLAEAGAVQAGCVVFHCSGALPAAALAAVAGCGAAVGSAHPVKSFTDPAAAVAGFAGTWCALEGDARALAVLRPAFEAIGGRCFAIDPRAKLLYHAASVFVCNDLAALLEVGLRAYAEAGLARETALEVMGPLVRETLENVLARGPAPALTGPVARGDFDLVARQLQTVEAWSPAAGALYRELGAVAVELARDQGRADPAALARLSDLLARR